MSGAPPVQCELRALAPEDVSDVAQVWFDSWHSIGLTGVENPALAALQTRLVDEGWITVVAVVGRDIFGFIAYEPEHHWLRQIFIKPAWKHRGIGTALMDSAKRAMPFGFWLRTQLDNLIAQRFYERAGMTRSGQEALSRSGDMIVKYVWPVGFQIETSSTGEE